MVLDHILTAHFSKEGERERFRFAKITQETQIQVRPLDPNLHNALVSEILQMDLRKRMILILMLKY